LKKYPYILAGLLAVLASASVQAREVALSPAAQWTGVYLGVHGGSLRADQEVTLDVNPTLFGKPESSFAGVQIGYWAPLSANWLYGFEADLSFAGNDTDPATGVTSQFDRFGTARTRIGYANGPWLLFASGGLAWARMSADNITGSTAINTRHSFLGWLAGAGVEYALSQRWSARAEYLFADFDSNFEDLFGLTAGPKISFSAIRLGLNYRIGSLPAVTARTAAMRRGAFDWSGAYIGVHGGYATGAQTMQYGTFTVPFKPKGGFGGVQGGFNWQLPSRVVLGIESDIAFGKIEGDFLDGCCVVKIDRLGTVRLRAGYAFDTLLLYATGGVVWATTNNRYLTGVAFSDRPLVGATFGVGAEYALSPLWSIKGEYLRVNFSPNRTDHVGTSPFDETAQYDLYRVGLNYRASLFDILARR